jgi:hypothetical protein
VHDESRRSAERCGRIVRSFLAMARQRETQQRLVAMHELVDGTLQLLAYGLRSGGIVVEQDIPGDLPKLLCDPDQMQQALMNLLVNARQAVEEQPRPRRIRIEARAIERGMELAVSDSGPGIDARDRFPRVRPVRHHQARWRRSRYWPRRIARYRRGAWRDADFGTRRWRCAMRGPPLRDASQIAVPVANSYQRPLLLTYCPAIGTAWYNLLDYNLLDYNLLDYNLLDYNLLDKVWSGSDRLK